MRNGSAPKISRRALKLSAANMKYLKKPSRHKLVTTHAVTARRCSARVAPGRVMTRPQMKSAMVVNAMSVTNHGSHQP